MRQLDPGDRSLVVIDLSTGEASISGLREKIVNWMRSNGFTVRVVALDSNSGRLDIRSVTRWQLANILGRRGGHHPVSVVFAGSEAFSITDPSGSGFRLRMPNKVVNTVGRQDPVVELIQGSGCIQVNAVDRRGRRGETRESFTVSQLVFEAVDAGHHSYERRAATIGGGPVVVLATARGLWNSVDHGIEIAWQLAQRSPAVRMRWAYQTDDDKWLATHDMAHAGLRDRVELFPAGNDSLLANATAVVTTGYDDPDCRLLLEATHRGIPVVGLADLHLTSLKGPTSPFNIEALIDQVEELTADSDLAAAEGQAQRELVLSELNEQACGLLELLRIAHPV